MMGNHRHTRPCRLLLMLGAWTADYLLMFSWNFFPVTNELQLSSSLVTSVEEQPALKVDAFQTSQVTSYSAIKPQHSLLPMSEKLWNNSNSMKQMPHIDTRNQSAWRPLPSSHVKASFPIFAASLPKSGTTSIHSFFLCGRVRSVHHFCPRQIRIGALMKRNIQNDKPPFQGCERLDTRLQELGPVKVFTDTGYVLPSGGPCYYPSVSALDAMYKAYPNMTIVLGTRNSTQWATSIQSWGKGSLLKRWLKYCPFVHLHHINNTTASTDTNQILINFYDWHTEHIRAFAKRHPSITFVEFQIDSPDAGTKLEEQTSISSNCWRHLKPIDPSNRSGTRAKKRISATIVP